MTIFEHLMELSNELKQAYENKGMRASGEWAESVEVVLTDKGGQIWANDYSEQLEFGRKSGKFPPLKDIEKWIVDKGVFAEALRTIKLSSLAFLIARKIANSGWKREGYGGVELISSVLTPQRLQVILDDIGANQTMQVVNELEKIYDTF